MNLSGKPKEFTLTDLEETNGEPVKVKITPLSPTEVDEIALAQGGIDFGKIAKFYRLAKTKGINLSDFKMEGLSDEEKIDKMITLLDESGADLSDISVRKRTATRTHKLLEKHIVGWSGVFGDNGKSVDFSKEIREKFLTALPAVVKDQIVEAIEHLTEHGVLPGEKNSSAN
jgi:hypothetical protein